MTNCKDREQRRKKPGVVNLGITTFYDALVTQKVKAVQVHWQPPAPQSEEMKTLLDLFL